MTVRLWCCKEWDRNVDSVYYYYWRILPPPWSLCSPSLSGILLYTDVYLLVFLGVGMTRWWAHQPWGCSGAIGMWHWGMGSMGGGWGLVLLEVFSYPRDATVPFTLGSHQHPTLPCCPSSWTPMLLVPTLLLTEHCTQFKYCCFNNLRPVAVQREDKPAVFPVPPRLLTLVSLLLQNSPHIMDLGSCRPHLDLILLIILNIKHNATAPLVLL